MKFLIALILTITSFTSTNGHAEDPLVGDTKAGKKIFNKCKACHTFKQNGKNRVGPNLFNIVDSQIASNETFKYSKSFKKAKAAEEKIVWNDENLNTFLIKPKKFIKGTKMIFSGLKKPQQRADLIAWLKTLTPKDTE